MSAAASSSTTAVTSSRWLPRDWQMYSALAAAVLVAGVGAWVLLGSSDAPSTKKKKKHHKQRAATPTKEKEAVEKEDPVSDASQPVIQDDESYPELLYTMPLTEINTLSKKVCALILN
jgi:cell division protein FtsN